MVLFKICSRRNVDDDLCEAYAYVYMRCAVIKYFWINYSEKAFYFKTDGINWNLYAKDGYCHSWGYISVVFEDEETEEREKHDNAVYKHIMLKLYSIFQKLIF